MKNSTLLLLLVLFISTCCTHLYAQVGINTINPTAGLDINGTLRIRSLELTSDGFRINGGNAIYIMGVDKMGNVIPIEIGENVKLENNKLKSVMPEFQPLIGLPDGVDMSDIFSSDGSFEINNLDVGIVVLPGGRRSRPIIRLNNGSDTGDVDITGIMAAEDGQQITLYPTSGKIKLRKLDSASLSDNQFAMQNNINVKQYEMVTLMYDNIIKKWVVVSAPRGDD